MQQRDDPPNNPFNQPKGISKDLQMLLKASTSLYLNSPAVSTRQISADVQEAIKQAPSINQATSTLLSSSSSRSSTYTPSARTRSTAQDFAEFRLRQLQKDAMSAKTSFSDEQLPGNSSVKAKQQASEEARAQSAALLLISEAHPAFVRNDTQDFPEDDIEEQLCKALAEHGYTRNTELAASHKQVLQTHAHNHALEATSDEFLADLLATMTAANYMSEDTHSTVETTLNQARSIYEDVDGAAAVATDTTQAASRVCEDGAAAVATDTTQAASRVCEDGAAAVVTDTTQAASRVCEDGAAAVATDTTQAASSVCEERGCEDLSLKLDNLTQADSVSATHEPCQNNEFVVQGVEQEVIMHASSQSCVTSLYPPSSFASAQGTSRVSQLGNETTSVQGKAAGRPRAESKNVPGIESLASAIVTQKSDLRSSNENAVTEVLESHLQAYQSLPKCDIHLHETSAIVYAPPASVDLQIPPTSDGVVPTDAAALQTSLEVSSTNICPSLGLKNEHADKQTDSEDVDVRRDTMNDALCYRQQTATSHQQGSSFWDLPSGQAGTYLDKELWGSTAHCSADQELFETNVIAHCDSMHEQTGGPSVQVNDVTYTPPSNYVGPLGVWGPGPPQNAVQPASTAADVGNPERKQERINEYFQFVPAQHNSSCVGPLGTWGPGKKTDNDRDVVPNAGPIGAWGPDNDKNAVTNVGPLSLCGLDNEKIVVPGVGPLGTWGPGQKADDGKDVFPDVGPIGAWGPGQKTDNDKDVGPIGAWGPDNDEGAGSKQHVGSVPIGPIGTWGPGQSAGSEQRVGSVPVGPLGAWGPSQTQDTRKGHAGSMAMVGQNIVQSRQSSFQVEQHTKTDIQHCTNAGHVDNLGSVQPQMTQVSCNTIFQAAQVGVEHT